MARKSREINEAALKRDYKEKGLSLRQLGQKYGISTTKVRNVLGKAISGEVTQKKREEVKKALKAKGYNRAMKNRKQLEAAEMEVYKEVLQTEMIDIFKGIRQSVEDMLQLNKQTQEAVPEMQKDLQQLLRYYENAEYDPESMEHMQTLRKFHTVLDKLDNFYLQGKLRIESRKELGSWFDRYKDFMMQEQIIKNFEGVIIAIFEGLNSLEFVQYENVKTIAISINPSAERYFNQNEEQAAETDETEQSESDTAE